MSKFPAVFLLFFISISVNSQNIDIEILRSVNIGRNKGLDNSFRFVSKSTTPISIAIPVVIMAKGFATHDRDEITKGITIASSLVTASLVATAIKYSVNRERPFITYPDIEQGTDVDTPSLPSGHTSDAFCTATALTLAYRKWYVAVPSYTWASVVGYSRMHLGVHYPSDLLIGAATGSASAFLCYRLEKWINKK